MKKLIFFILFALLSIGILSAQEESNNITVMTAIGAYDDGFNIGVQYEYQVIPPLYVGVETVFFPNLNNLDYLHLIGRVGLNTEFGNPVGILYRPYMGVRVGKIWREYYGGKNALLGGEVGIQITNTQWKNIYAKLIYTYDSKTDSAIWNEDNHQVWSIWSGIGVRF